MQQRSVASSCYFFFVPTVHSFDNICIIDAGSFNCTSQPSWITGRTGASKRDNNLPPFALHDSSLFQPLHRPI